MNPRKFATVAAAGIAATLIAAGAQALAFTNGSFEANPPNSVPGYNELGGGSTAIPGWTTVLSGVEWVDPNAGGVPDFGDAEDGRMIVDLANYVYTGGGLEQTFDTLAGTTYRVSFSGSTIQDYGRDGTGKIDVTAPGYSHTFGVSNLTATLVWTQFVFDFVATGASSTLRFSNSEDPYAHFAMIDAVSVTAVPLPAAAWLMLSGLLGLGAVARRRIGVSGAATAAA